MRERPILFSAPMVRAILSGAKTQTRRIVKGTALEWLAPEGFTPEFVADPDNGLCPYGQPGDRLWVRETWRTWERPDDGADGVRFEADDSFRVIKNTREAADLWVDQHNAKSSARGSKWRPSIHMPRWASRLTLEITDVRVERLQSISEEDARAEGFEAWATTDGRGTFVRGTAREEFLSLWANIYGVVSLHSNPWVWATSFKRVESAARAA